MKQLPVLFEGSVKTVRGIEGQGPYIFEYTDKYSIYDWGEMPDKIEDKGKCLSFIGNLFFSLLGKSEEWVNWTLSTPKLKENFENSSILKSLRSKGLKHHCLGPVKGYPNQLAVTPMTIYKPQSSTVDGELKWDYSDYAGKVVDCLVPLEVIFRFGVPEGSSLLKRTNSKKYCTEIGLDHPPKTNDTFEVPVIEYSTKLEPSDRYLSYEKAQEISGLSATEFKKLHDLTSLIALRIKDYFSTVDIELWDGKFEYGFSTNEDDPSIRDFQLIDSIGPDELRLIYQGRQLSKENLRHFYNKSPWKEGVQKAKTIAKNRGLKDWKGICINELKLTPDNLDINTKNRIEMMYKSLAKTLGSKFNASQPVFEDACTLNDLIEKEDFNF